MRFHTRKWVKPEDLNANGTLFGGKLLAWIDEEAALYSIVQLENPKVVTKFMSEINFMSAAKQGDIVEIGLDVVYFGKSSLVLKCEVRNMMTREKIITIDNITMVNGAPWIVSKRQKTGVPFQIKLLDIPMQIVERYKSFRKGNHLFNIGNLDSINKRIKKVAAMCGIKKRVSFHVSRHSWAVLALEYGMPIESVSKILGHTNITTTQIYAKVTSTKLDHDISVFESRIKGHLPVMGGMA